MTEGFVSVGWVGVWRANRNGAILNRSKIVPREKDADAMVAQWRKDDFQPTSFHFGTEEIFARVVAPTSPAPAQEGKL